MIKVIRAKLHGIRVTNADLDYHGSITLDPEHCAAAGIFPLEFVEIWNKNSGARISTYVIFGEPGSRCCILNGAAARTCQIGDEIIIAAADYIERGALADHDPVVLTFNPDNSVYERLHYRVRPAEGGRYDFAIVSEFRANGGNGNASAAAAHVSARNS
ncbi:MAG TPA: aspartate 1-decarboxylase [Xanthobacteraceae bacterium]